MAAKKKGVDININVKGAKELVKEGKKWHEEEKKNKCRHWGCHGSGFWGFGAALAMILSYAQNSSIGWAILHGIISWIYVIYRVFTDYNVFG